MAGIQAARLLSAMLEVCAERGAANVTVAHVVARAGVSRRTFYELFADRDDCLLAALDHAFAMASERVARAYESQRHAPGAQGWRERVRAGLLALLRFLDEEPAMGRMLIVESLGAGPRALERRRGVLARVAAAVHEGRPERRAREELQALTAEGVVGGALSVVHARMLEGDRRPLSELANPLMSMIVLPYLGPAAARRELARPLAVPRRAPRSAVSPLKDLDIRVTYRTMRVLQAIGEHPGSSNRRIGNVAGMSDQGQISKLLARLRRRGLIENTGDEQARGMANAWRLTPRGRQLRTALDMREPGIHGTER